MWEKKPEIEQAFHMEEPAGLDDSGEGTLEHPQRRHGPMPPPRHESYLLKLNDGYVIYFYVNFFVRCNFYQKR